jgi:signal transduction histidine kinase
VVTSDDGRVVLMTKAREAITPACLGISALSQLVESALDGIAVVDPSSGRYVYVNPSGCRLLNSSVGELTGVAASMFDTVLAVDPGADAPSRVETVIVGTREFECTASRVDAGTGPLSVVRFRDVTDARLQQRRLKAFARTSASIAFAGDLRTVLDRLAADVRQATGMVACTFLLMDEDGDLRQAGTSGEYPNVPDYNNRLNACRRLGAPLVSDEAFESRVPQVVKGWRVRTLADPRFGPIHDINLKASWHSIAVVPLVVRDRITGVFNGFYLEGHEPGEADVAFLSAIADQAAVAVENARLVGEVEAKAALEQRHLLARELHDSVSQALFSLTLQTRAVQLALRQDPGDTLRLERGLAEITDLNRGALAEMRALIFQLRPAALHEEGLVSAVRKHVDAVAAKEGLTVEVDGPEDALDLQSDMETELFRVVQEAVHNVVKHAEARKLTVRIGLDDLEGGPLVIEVVDDGHGFDVMEEHPGHLGLRSMSERVQHLGGSLVVESTVGRFTVVRATVPVNPRDPSAPGAKT